MSTAGIYSAPASRVADPASQEFSRINIWSLKGRLGRVRYVAYSIGFGMLLNVVGPVFVGITGEFAGGLVTIAALTGWICIHALLSAQRAHDFNVTGWLAITAFIPVVSFVFWFVPGTNGENRFGKQTPPNGVGVTIAAWIIPVLAIVGIVAAIVIPALVS